MRPITTQAAALSLTLLSADYLTASHSGTAFLFGTAASIFLTFDLRAVIFFCDIRDSITDKASIWLNCVVK